MDIVIHRYVLVKTFDYSIDLKEIILTEINFWGNIILQPHALLVTPYASRGALHDTILIVIFKNMPHAFYRRWWIIHHWINWGFDSIDVFFFRFTHLCSSFFYTPVWKTDVLCRGNVRPSVCPSVRPSGFSGLFFNMLWDINLKLGIYIQ